jgi:hypothetical protein
VAKAPADGYTILMSESAHIMSAAVGAKLPYDPINDFQPISLAATIPFGLTVNSAMPVHTLNEFIAYSRKSPKPLTYGTAGIGAPHHFAVELLRSMTGINVVHVPYKGPARSISPSRPRTRCCPTTNRASCGRLRSRRRSAPRSCPTCRRSPKRDRCPAMRSTCGWA